MGELGAGARAVFPGREGREVRGPGVDDGLVQGQSGRETRVSGGGSCGEGSVAVRGAGVVAAASGGDGRGVSVDGESAEFGEGAGYTVRVSWGREGDSWTAARAAIVFPSGYDVWRRRKN